MADKNENISDLSEFDTPASPAAANKELWLFLIVLDVIVLCVLGFFLYKNLSAKLLVPPVESLEVAEENTPLFQEAVVVEQVVAAQPVKVTEPVVVDSVKEEVIQASSVPVEPVQGPAIVEVQNVAEKPAVQEVKAVPGEKKESVLVSVNPKSKYRQVTFRYFEPAKSVAVVSGFTMAKPRAMSQKKGIWETTLSIAPGTYKYLLVVDGVQQTDPHAPEKDGRSVLVVK